MICSIDAVLGLLSSHSVVIRRNLGTLSPAPLLSFRSSFGTWQHNKATLWQPPSWRCCSFHPLYSTDWVPFWGLICGCGVSTNHVPPHRPFSQPFQLRRPSKTQVPLKKHSPIPFGNLAPCHYVQDQIIVSWCNAAHALPQGTTHLSWYKAPHTLQR